MSLPLNTEASQIFSPKSLTTWTTMLCTHANLVKCQASVVHSECNVQTLFGFHEQPTNPLEIKLEFEQFRHRQAMVLGRKRVFIAVDSTLLGSRGND